MPQADRPDDAPPAAQTQVVRPRRVDVVAGYDLGVERYEDLWSPIILPAATALVPWLGLRVDSVVADVGAGTGALLDSLRAASPEGRVISLDASRQMLRVALERRAAFAVQADASALPLATGTAHVVVMAFMLFHLEDPPGAVREAARVLRPAGRVGIVTWSSEETEGAESVWERGLAEAGLPPAPTRRSDVGLDSPEALATLCHDAGLRPERIWTQQLTKQWDPDTFWQLRSGAGSNRRRLQSLAAEDRDALLNRLRAQLHDLPADHFSWRGEVVLAVATHSDGR